MLIEKSMWSNLSRILTNPKNDVGTILMSYDGYAYKTTPLGGYDELYRNLDEHIMNSDISIARMPPFEYMNTLSQISFKIPSSKRQAINELDV